MVNLFYIAAAPKLQERGRNFAAYHQQSAAPPTLKLAGTVAILSPPIARTPLPMGHKWVTDGTKWAKSLEIFACSSYNEHTLCMQNIESAYEPWKGKDYG